MANCNKIDDLSVHLLRLMNELMHCKIQIENAMCEGFMYMAKSRILLGKERVSILQIPVNCDEDIDSIYTVLRESDDEDGFSLVENCFQRCLKLEDAGEKISVSSESAKDMKLIHRASENVNDSTKSSDFKEHIISDGVVENLELLKRKKKVDTLNWFGVLVPQELRMAQKAFKKAISLSVNCANIQCKVEALRMELENSKSSIH